MLKIAKTHHFSFRIPAAVKQNVGKFDLLHAQPLSTQTNLVNGPSARQITANDLKITFSIV